MVLCQVCVGVLIRVPIDLLLHSGVLVVASSHLFVWANQKQCISLKQNKKRTNKLSEGSQH